MNFFQFLNVFKIFKFLSLLCLQFLIISIISKFFFNIFTIFLFSIIYFSLSFNYYIIETSTFIFFIFSINFLKFLSLNFQILITFFNHNFSSSLFISNSYHSSILITLLSSNSYHSHHSSLIKLQNIEIANSARNSSNLRFSRSFKFISKSRSSRIIHLGRPVKTNGASRQEMKY